jgi:dipeptidyl aminopeptidase/acylaminoacyl peptidase
MRRFILAFTLIASALLAAAQAKHPFTFEDMMKLKRLGEPEVSLDGKWVIFSVVDVNLEANTKTPHIWIVPLVGAEEKSGDQKNRVPHVSPSLRDAAGQERELISDQDADRPRWDPNGKRFAFISTKEGGSQVWIADFDAAEGKVTHVDQLTSIATEASGERWSPDGKNILFKSDVYPECDGAPKAETACNAKKLEEFKQSKVKAQIFDHLLYRHWDSYREGKRSHLFVVAVNDCVGTAAPGCPAGPARDLTPGDYDAPVFSLGGQDNYAFSPDGQEICYTSNHDKNPAASTNNDLWLVPVNVSTSPLSTDHVGTEHVGADAFVRPASAASAARSEVRAAQPNNDVAEVLAQTRNITADNPASDSTPLYSPDGRYIAYRAQQRPGYEADRFRLMLYDRKTGRKQDLIPGFSSWVGSFAWAPDSSRIYFSSEEQGNSPISVIQVSPRFLEHDYAGVSQPQVPEIVAPDFNDDVAITPDGTTLVFARMSLQYPTEIYKLVGKNPAVALTHTNDELLSQVSMSPPEPFWFTGAHNDKVQGFLVKPPNFDPSKKYPVKFLIHGGPQGAWGDDWSYRWNPELFSANGYVVIMINFHGSNGYGQKFMDAINGDWGGAPYEDLMKGLDYAEKTYPFIDKDRECALGASYGGYMTNWILGHTDRFKCIVTHDGMFNAESAWGTTEELWFNNWEFKGTPYDNRAGYEKWSPHQYAKNFKTPTLVIHGQKDYRLDVSEGLQLFTTLQMEGVPSKMLYFPDEGHWVLKPQNSRLWYETVNAWVEQWTKK